MQASTQPAFTKTPKTGASGLPFEQFELTLLVLTVAATLCFLIQAAHFLPVVSDNMYPEAAGVLSAQHWANSSPLYQDFRKPPYLLAAFPPLWYAAIGLGASAGIESIDSLTLFGRLLTLASLFGIVTVAFLWNRRLGLSRRSSLLSPTLYLSFPILIPWAVTARPDLPALLFSVLAVYIAARQTGKTGSVLSGTFAAIAFLTRHNSVAVPVAVVLWLVSKKRWKHAMLFSAVWWLIVGTTIVVCQKSSGGLFLLNLGGSKFGSLAFTYARDVILRLFTSPESGFAVLLFALGAFAAMGKDPDERTGLLKFYLTTSLFFATLGSAAAGAAANHFLEPALAMAMLAPSGLNRLRKNWTGESSWAKFATVLVLFLVLPALDMQRWNAMHGRPEDLRPLVQLAKNRRVFTDIPYIGARTSTPEFLDPASLTYAEKGSGLWSSQGLANELEQRQYDLVIAGEPLNQPYDPTARYPRYVHLGMKIRIAINRNYDLCGQVDHEFIYVPMSPDRTPINPACALIRNYDLQK